MITLETVTAAQAGNKAAVDLVVRGCEAYIKRQVRKQRRPDLAEDLTQAALIGVLRALKDFDSSRGVRFINYAAWWIRDAMQVEQRRSDSDGITGTNTHRQIKAIRAEAKAVSQGTIVVRPRYTRTPSEYRRLVDRAPRLGAPIAMGERQGSGGEGEMMRTLQASKAREVLSALPGQTRTVVELRHFHGETWREISRRTGLSHKRVRELEAKGLDKLRAAMGD